MRMETQNNGGRSAKRIGLVERCKRHGSQRKMGRILGSMDSSEITGRRKGKKRKRYDTKEEAEAAARDNRDRDPDYVRSEEDSSMDPTYAPSRKELRRADEEGDK